VLRFSPARRYAFCPPFTTGLHIVPDHRHGLNALWKVPYICLIGDRPEEGNLDDAQKQRFALFVDKRRQQWVVRDSDGRFWILPSVEHPWDHRQPFHPTAETELEPVPGHYKDMLRLPF
jgi:hypothetical protein